MTMPYRHGFSEESIHHNIALFVREGYPQDQAVAMALEIARKAWRREHPRGKYPKHLKGMRGPKRRRGKRRARHNHAMETREAKYGKQYLYEYEYTDPYDPGAGTLTGRAWRYSPTHLIDAFYESNDGDSWKLLRYAVVHDNKIRAKWAWHRA